MRNVQGLVAWVTGAGTGIGEATALMLAAAGVKVALSGRREALLSDVATRISAAGGTATVVPLDVTDRAGVTAAAAEITAELGQIDILFNNHGLNVQDRDWAGSAVDGWDDVIDVNVKGVYNCTAAVLPAMRQRGDGLIINTASMAGKRFSQRAGIAYGASKHAVMALNELLNLEEGNNGIRACAICPGEVDTAILDYRPVPVPAADRDRLIQPEDVAETVLFVARLNPRSCPNEILLTPTHKRRLQPGEPG